MDTTRTPAPRLTPTPTPATRLAPGLALAFAAAVGAWAVQLVVPALSALLVAILLGVVVTHVWRMPEAVGPGMKVAAKRVLRLGIVVLGLQLALDDILALGFGVLAVVVVIVAGGILGTLALGRWMSIPRPLTMLIACGFSICGAAAVAAVEGNTDSDEDDVASAIGLVVLFGTIMIFLLPLLLAPLGIDDRTRGLIAGGSIHEVAQVVAVGGIIGGGALTVAVVVKLARVLMLAPVIFTLSLVQRRAGGTDAGALPPIVPLFVLGFLAMALVRTFLPLPSAVLDVGQFVQTLLLGAAMFALGTGVHVSLLKKVGGRPLVLGVVSTALVFGLAFMGMILLG
ncbi:YeiH family protein [Janibacter sp. GS2]|uniref:YeiH family protein n=1 Tax=Janibacter sp. GS2 TaxID=3442646 RepID=UPI003EC0D937